MSLYNMIFGQNPCADILLAILGLDRSMVGRYQDCYTNEDGTRIIVHTRNGGGNRDLYQEVIDELAKHPCYESDADDDFDCTYANIVFKVPEKFAEAVKHIADQTDTTPPAEKWQKLLSDLKSGNDNQKTANALNVGKQIFGAITEGKSGEIKNPEGSMIVELHNPKDDQ